MIECMPTINFFMSVKIIQNSSCREEILSPLCSELTKMNVNADAKGTFATLR